ncbi:DUF5906 domain-containing protein [Mesorhizobium sp. LHD-90]|uniref:primase-helicase family protein n=1 Tax=Mesorhizobium sp. LHD-90 TaxID=3071414 RepID=UPI0027E01A67|nr:DUF5906 domain-containing protein [Mesorhizobium sp. LHD-90]MDQ6433771.1 DUF5906 domain-containing protein [Mesorhizobium sp. LHD-90]
MMSDAETKPSICGNCNNPIDDGTVHKIRTFRTANGPGTCTFIRTDAPEEPDPGNDDPKDESGLYAGEWESQWLGRDHETPRVEIVNPDMKAVSALRTIEEIVAKVQQELAQGTLSADEARKYVRYAARLEQSEIDLDILIDILSAKEGLRLSEKALFKEYQKARVKFVSEQMKGGHHDPDVWLEWCLSRFRIIRNYGGKLAIIPKNRSSDGAVQPPMFKKAFEDASLERKVFIGIDKNGNPVLKGVHPWYLTHPEADRYDTQIFKPVLGAIPGEYNVWQGWPWARATGNVYEPNSHGWPSVSGVVEDGSTKWPKIYHYLNAVVCSSNKEHFAYLLFWLAHWVQFPLEYNTTVIGIRGKPGTGKTKLLELVKSLIGADYSHIFTHPESLKRNFNALMLYRLFLGFDEAFAVGDKTSDAVFKNLTTGEVYTVEKKFIDAFEARKFFRMIFASNEHWFMNADFGDRRQFLLTCSEIHQKDAAYFAALDEAIGIGKSGATGEAVEMWAFFEFLTKVPLANFDLRNIPKTSTLVSQQLHSLRGKNRILHSVLEAGLLPFDPAVMEMISARSFDASYPEGEFVEAHYVPTQWFLRMLMDSGHAYRMDAAQAGYILSVMSAGGKFAAGKSVVTQHGRIISRDQHWYKNENQTGRWIGSLWLSRRLAEKHYEVSGLEWNNDAIEWSIWH